MYNICLSLFLIGFYENVVSPMILFKHVAVALRADGLEKCCLGASFLWVIRQFDPVDALAVQRQHHAFFNHGPFVPQCVLDYYAVTEMVSDRFGLTSDIPDLEPGRRYLVVMTYVQEGDTKVHAFGLDVTDSPTRIYDVTWPAEKSCGQKNWRDSLVDLVAKAHLNPADVTCRFYCYLPLTQGGHVN